MRYKVGDKVVIRDDLKSGRNYGYLYCNTHMVKLRGRTEQIKRVTTNESYLLEGDFDSWFFTDEMIDHEATAKLNEVKPVDLLETGMVVQLNNGEVMLVLTGDLKTILYGNQNKALVGINFWTKIKGNYNPNLDNQYYPDLSIDRIYKRDVCEFSSMLQIDRYCELIWERP